jgi:cytochrome c553
LTNPAENRHGLFVPGHENQEDEWRSHDEDMRSPFFLFGNTILAWRSANLEAQRTMLDMKNSVCCDPNCGPLRTISTNDDKRGGKWVERMSLSLRILVATAATSFLLGTATAAAQDIEYGEYLSNQCTTCHQLSGKDNGIPPIVGWDAESFIAVLGSYKRKERENQAMQTIAASLGEEEIAALAAYFATLKPQE